MCTDQAPGSLPNPDPDHHDLSHFGRSHTPRPTAVLQSGSHPSHSSRASSPVGDGIRETIIVIVVVVICNSSLLLLYCWMERSSTIEEHTTLSWEVRPASGSHNKNPAITILIIIISYTLPGSLGKEEQRKQERGLRKIQEDQQHKKNSQELMYNVGRKKRISACRMMSQEEQMRAEESQTRRMKE